MSLQQKIIDKKHNQLIGREFNVLIDSVPKKDLPSGRSQFDAPDVDGLIYVKGKNIKVGDLIKVKITDNMLYDLVGEKI